MAGPVSRSAGARGLSQLHPRDPGAFPFSCRKAPERRRARLAVIGDIACDPTSDFSPVKVYDAVTDWKTAPARRGPWRTTRSTSLAIDNLPSLLPRESSERITRRSSCRRLRRSDAMDGGVWARARSRVRTPCEGGSDPPLHPGRKTPGEARKGRGQSPPSHARKHHIRSSSASANIEAHRLRPRLEERWSENMRTAQQVVGPWAPWPRPARSPPPRPSRRPFEGPTPESRTARQAPSPRLRSDGRERPEIPLRTIQARAP